MAGHRYRLIWQSGFCTTAVEVNGYSSPREALLAAVTDAKELGWTPPKWWQWWRWVEPLRYDPTLKTE